MLTNEQEEIIGEALLPLFQYLEHSVIVDVAQRILSTMAYSRTAEIEAQRLQQLGYSPAKIRKAAMKLLQSNPEFRKEVAKNTLEHKKTVKKLLKEILKAAEAAGGQVMQESADLSYLDDLRTWKQAGKEITDNSYLPQLVEAIRKQTNENMKSLAGSTGFKTMSGFETMENLYRRELDKAMIQVCTGTFSREQVIYDTVHSLADSGLRTIDFSSGYSMQLDTAVKLAVRTGSGQIAAKIMDENITRTGENLVYVSKHWGARNTGNGHANHEQWQGRVYYIKEGEDYNSEARRIGQDYITDLWRATGYSADGDHENDPLGLHGYNCRHKHYVWFIGSSLPDEDPQPDPVTIDGKTYDYYQITQKMRTLERKIRALKREREAMAALGQDTKEISGKIKQKIKNYQDFCKNAKVKPDINRLRYECKTSDLTKTEAWKEYEINSMVEYRIMGDDGKSVQLRERINLSQVLNTFPLDVQKRLNEVTFRINSQHGSGYLHSKKAIYITEDATRGEIIHEVGHYLEYTVFDSKKVDALKKHLVQGLTKDDIIVKIGVNSSGQKAKIFLLQSNRFANEYQSRLYIDRIEEALLPDGSINTDVLGEVISVAVEKYYRFPKTLKKWFPEMYELVEETLYGR